MPGMDDYQLKYDEQGRPYFQVPGQPRNYVSPVALGGTKPEDTTGIFRHGPEWNQHNGKWETPIDWGNIANIAAITALTAGATNAAGLWGPGAGGGGGAASAFNPAIGGGYIPGGEFALPASLAAENAAAFSPFVGGGYIPGAESTLPTALAAENAGGITPPLGGVRPPTPPTAPPGNSLVDRLRDPRNAAALASLIPLLMSRNGGGSGAGSGAGDFAQMPQLNSLLDMSVNRAQRTDPLHQAVTQLAMSRLPINMQQGQAAPYTGGAPSGAVPRQPGRGEFTSPGGRIVPDEGY